MNNLLVTHSCIPPALISLHTIMGFVESSEGPTFTWNISESVLNSSESSVDSLSEIDETETKIPAAGTTPVLLCQPPLPKPPVLIRVTMPKVVSGSKTFPAKPAPVTNPYIDDDDDLGPEMARIVEEMENENYASKQSSRRVSVGEDLGDVFADEPGIPSAVDGNPTIVSKQQTFLPSKIATKMSGFGRHCVSASAAVGEKLAMGLKHGTVEKNISDALQKRWDGAEENTQRYQKTKAGDFDRMMQIIRENGGPELRYLATETVWDGFEEVPLLIDVLRNVKDRRYFLIILDECFKFFVEFAKKNDGDIYSCGSMHQKLKHIYATLNGKYHLSVKESEFGTTGTFRARISNIWTDERKMNPEFGQAKGMSEICVNDVEYIFKAIRDGVLCPKTDPYHLKLLMQFILLRLFALRSVEAATLDLKNVKWKKYDFGPDRGTKYVELFVDITKVRKLKLGSWKIPKNYGKVKVRDNPDDEVFNAYEMMRFYIEKLPEKKGR